MPFRPSRADLLNVARGALMGGADIIPGVSGGTVALILGIYDRLVTAVSQFDGTFATALRKRDLRLASEHVDARFLLALGTGIAVGVLTLGNVMHILLEDYRQFTMAVFFGLIAGSGVLVGRSLDQWTPLRGSLLIVGAVFAFWLVQQPDLQQPPDGRWYLFVCGSIAICAMILPGISGAFILLILGKYHEVTGIIKDTLHGDLSADAVLNIGVFGIGCAVGLLSFSKLLRRLLHSHQDATLAVLCGFMFGSLYKIWPFQRDVTVEPVESFKDRVFEPIPIGELSTAGDVPLTVTLMVASAGSIVLLDYLSGWYADRKLDEMEE